MLVIIGDFDVVRISINPDEAQTPLIVDTDQMPTLSFAFKGFEGVTGTFETGARLPTEELFRVLVSEAQDHAGGYSARHATLRQNAME